MITGLFLGKFMPPHIGHVALARFAEDYVDHLFIVVGSLKSEPIAGELRLQWMRQMFPNSTVLHLQKELPQLPEEHPDFWQLWREALLDILPEPPTHVFAGEDYGAPLAKVLGADFVPANMGREIIPTSGTDIRSNPFANWQYIPEAVRPYFVKRVCLVGAESTGKTTLAEKLAVHFETLCVPEYAYTIIAQKGRDLSRGDMEMIAKGQKASEYALAYSANRVLVCDTDVMTTSLWSEMLLGDCSEWIEKHARNEQYSLTFLMDTDTEWSADIHRYSTETREDFMRRCQKKLQTYNRDYILLSGTWQEKYETACRHIQELLST